MTPLQVTVFLLGTAGILYVTWPALRTPTSHGFYRGFAFQSLLLLTVFNLGHWFRDPLAPRQVVSWCLLLLSILLAAHGFLLLRVLGRPEGPVENTTQLVTSGAYRLIRHPLYASLFYYGWGAFAKRPGLLSGALVVVATAFLVATAQVEEAELIEKFGDAYRVYMRRTKRFIPFLF